MGHMVVSIKSSLSFSAEFEVMKGNGEMGMHQNEDFFTISFTFFMKNEEMAIDQNRSFSG